MVTPTLAEPPVIIDPVKFEADIDINSPESSEVTTPIPDIINDDFIRRIAILKSGSQLSVERTACEIKKNLQSCITAFQKNYCDPESKTPYESQINDFISKLIELTIGLINLRNNLTNRNPQKSAPNNSDLFMSEEGEKLITSLHNLMISRPEYFNHYLNWIYNILENNPELYRIGGIISHDFGHVFEPVFDVLQIQLMLKDSPQMELSSRLKGKIEDFFINLAFLIRFLKIFQKCIDGTMYLSFLEDPKERSISDYEHKHVTLKELLGTLDFRNCDIKVEGSVNYIFETFEAIIILHTLLLNSIKNGAKRIVIKLDTNEPFTSFRIFDDAKGNKWDEDYKQAMAGSYQLGMDNYDLPGVDSQKGGKISAFLLGQRAKQLEIQHIIKINQPLIRLFDGNESDKGMKCLKVKIPNFIMIPGANQNQIHSTENSSYLFLQEG